MHKTFFKTKTLLLKTWKPVLFLGFSIVLFSSCSKKDPLDKPAGGDATVSISVGLAPEQEVKKAGIKTMATSARTANGETILKTETLKGKGIEIDVTTAEGYDYSFNDKLETHKPLHRLQKVSATSPVSKQSGINKVAADVPMNTGVKYWIAFFNKATQEFEHSQQAVAGTPLTLDVVKNQEYEWYAYSYNNTDDISTLNEASGLVSTYTSAPFLYAKGVFKATASGDTPLAIIFEHQLQQIRFSIDTRGLFGNVSSAAVHFAQNTRAQPAFFDIRAGDIAQLQVEGEENARLLFNIVEDDSDRHIQAQYYSANYDQTDYHFEIDTLQVILPNGDTEDLVDFLPQKNISFSFSSGGKAKVHAANLRLWRTMPTKKILHLEGSTTLGYGASVKASGNFLKDPRNFGPQSDYLRIQGFTHEVIDNIVANSLSNALANPANYPDVIIAGMHNGLNTNDYTALETYLRRGGVVFLIVGNTPPVARNFFRKIFNSSAITLSIHDGGGTVYKLHDVDSDVLAWPFGDTRGRYWGRHVGGGAYINNIPPEEKEKIFVYTQSGANRDNQQGESVSMFRHKELNLFFVGDEGFLSNERENLQGQGSSGSPFATDVNNLPVPRTNYGHSSSASAPDPGKSTGSWEVDNSIIFGNVFAYLLAQSYYIPLDRSPL